MNRDASSHRRMWAGSRLTWNPASRLRVGQAVQRVSRIESVKHEVHNAQGLALTEEHDIVYRAAPQPGEPAPTPIATLLLELVRRHRLEAVIRRFEFKAVRPTFDLQPLRIHGQPSEDGQTARLWAQDHDGWLTMQGQAELA